MADASVKKSKKVKEEAAAGGAGAAGADLIAPTSVTAPLATSSWPLLLRNYDKLQVRVRCVWGAVAMC